MATTVVSLSPAEGLLARQISYWIDVSAAGKGGSKDNLGRGWTYLSADDLQGRVQDYDSVELSIPTIYRALRSLVKKGWFIREKLTAHRWFQVFHYTYGANHPSNSKSNGLDQSDQLEEIKADSSQLRDLPDSSTSKSIRQKTDVKTANSQGSPLAHKQPVASPLDSKDREFVPAPQSHWFSRPEPQSTRPPHQTPEAERVGFEPSVALPLQAIEGSAPSELIEELQSIETTYKNQLKALQKGDVATSVEHLHGMQGVRSLNDDQPVVESDSGSNEPSVDHQQEQRVAADLRVMSPTSLSSKDWLEHRIHNPEVEKTPRHLLPQSRGRKNGKPSAWDRIRALASQFEPAQVESVSPKQLINIKGERLRVDDGITSPTR